jgi:hypothetical protein
MASIAAWMACRAEESQASGKIRCWRAPPAADAEMFNNTQPRISDTVQPLRGPRSEVSDNRNAATQPRSLASRAGREGAEGLGTGPGNRARTTPVARESLPQLGTHCHEWLPTGGTEARASSVFRPQRQFSRRLSRIAIQGLGSTKSQVRILPPRFSHHKGSRAFREPSFCACPRPWSQDVRMRRGHRDRSDGQPTPPAPGHSP